MNSINTPSRIAQGPMLGNNKVSLSPIRSRRNQMQAGNNGNNGNSMTSMASVRSTSNCNNGTPGGVSKSRRKSIQYFCQNHNNKCAKFMIDENS